MGCSVAAYATPTPILNFQFNEGTGSTAGNTGSASGSATLTSPPTWSPNTPAGGGGRSLDFGSTASPTVYLDMGTPSSVKDLKSFTITGWLNCRDLNTGGGGNRILVNIQPGGDIPGVAQGIDLAFRDDGSLSLGVNQWNDWGGVRSRGGKITVDPNTPYSNWRFFAVTYNSLLTDGQVKFYFGSNMGAAELDISRYYPAGAVGPNAGNTLTIGNMNYDNRYDGTNQTFRGLIDQIRLYGSTTDGSGALTAADIKTIQSPIFVPQNGILYEEFTNIGGGTAISQLTKHPSYPNNPTKTEFRTTFEGYKDIKDSIGVRMSGWIKAPATGDYTFWITTDDNGELHLSTDANPANKRLIAYVPGYAGYTQWDKVFSGISGTPQKSALIPLIKDHFYYVEALMKEGGGGDHIRVQWQIPGGPLESPIANTHLFPVPPSGTLPSEYSLYEPFTSIKRGALGWKREAGVGTLYLESEGTKSMVLQNGTATFPRSLFFGGNFPNDPNNNDLGFRWERPTQNDYGALFLETQGGRWAYRVQSGSEMEPHTEFNRYLDLTGPDVSEESSTWSAFSSLHYMDGLLFDRHRVDMPTGYSYREHSMQNANRLIYQQDFTAGALTRKSSTHLSSEGLRYEESEGGVVTSLTFIDAEGLTAPVVRADKYVSTPKWKVVPDYVFEKGYKLRSLEETERFVKEKKHLPEIPSAKEMSTKGVDLADMNLKLLKKVEELTLHMIAMDKELKLQKKNNIRLERKLGTLEAGKGN
jgi:hypothetical protein